MCSFWATLSVQSSDALLTVSCCRAWTDRAWSVPDSSSESCSTVASVRCRTALPCHSHSCVSPCTSRLSLSAANNRQRWLSDVAPPGECESVGTGVFIHGRKGHYFFTPQTQDANLVSVARTADLWIVPQILERSMDQPFAPAEGFLYRF